MSKIQSAFTDKNAFIPFLTVGDPSLDKTYEFILEMEKAGAALIELGIPFSDPIAEGPVIQAANVRALSAGCTTDKVFELVERVREKTQIPLVFLTYLNPVFKYGYERFCSRCKEAGVDGLIIPDMPFEEKKELKDIAGKYDVDIISLVAPTSKERIEKIAKDAEGYIYVVSSMGVTGVRSEIKTDVRDIVSHIKAVTDVPVAIGFGINTRQQVQEFSEYCDGVIVGSAIVKLIEKHGENAAEPIGEYIRQMIGR
ncbi:MAG: tryptophan synthase subunit alpha [Lachnospiraceae bacterium]|nr:tryptophan synthase subunit alpha [Lachnospiraceae bacterium]